MGINNPMLNFTQENEWRDVAKDTLNEGLGISNFEAYYKKSDIEAVQSQ